MTVSDRFFKLLDAIDPSPRELHQYESHRSTVATRLSTVFPDTKVEVIGSHARTSAIAGSSDLDLLAILPTSHVYWGQSLKTSDTVIKNVRDELLSRYAGTAIGKDGVAVVANFGNGAFSVDIVPAFVSSFAAIGPGGTKRPVYAIPDGKGGWFPAAPKSHAEYIAEADRASGGKLKGVARLLKFWTTTRASRIPISSFHIEMVLASTRVCGVGMSYSDCLAGALRTLKQRGLAALRDPLGVSPDIEAASSPVKRSQALTSVTAASERADQAILNEACGAQALAYASWDSVFNGHFPKR